MLEKTLDDWRSIGSLSSRVRDQFLENVDEMPEKRHQQTRKRIDGAVRLTAEADAGRIDRYLARLDLGLSRARIQSLIEEGWITVDGRTTRPSGKLKGGEMIRVEVPPSAEPTAAPENLPLEIVYQDAWLVVVAKARGVVMHPAPGHASGTLVNALLHHCPDLSGVGGVLRPGIVHRLDKDTSGLLVVAKDDRTHRALQSQFRGRSVRKVYLALALGRLTSEGVIDQPVGRHPVDRKRMTVDAPRAKPAVTRWKTLQELAATTLVQAHLETGRTHQLRVHLASLGHPIVGDPVYGGIRGARGVADARVRRRLLHEKSQALHAWKLGFCHPQTGEELHFEAPLPEAMARLIADLGGTPPRVEYRNARHMRLPWGV